MRTIIGLCLVMAAMAGGIPANAQQLGRCCYDDPAGVPACAVNTQPECSNLGGQWTAGLTCDVPCDSHCVTCGAGDLIEPEPCPNFPDTLDSGCYSDFPRFIPLECGMAVCGSAWATPGGTVPGFVDHDAYIFTLPQDTFVSICVRAEYAFTVELYHLTAAAPCPGTVVARNAGDTCGRACIDTCLPAGTYAFYTQPVFGQTIECLPYRLVMHCAPCPEPCVVECPPTAVPENESCPPVSFESDSNGGCLRSPHLFEPIECGMTICGTSWRLPGEAAPGPSDVDAYQVFVTTPTRLSFCVVGEFAPLVAVVAHNDSCPMSSILATASGLACDTVCLSICVPTGVYDFYVVPAPNLNMPFVCERYVVHLSCEPCCAPSRPVIFDGGQVPQCKCVHLCPGSTVPIRVCGSAMDPTRPPMLTVTPGCSNPDFSNGHCNEDCEAIPASALFYNNAGWVWVDSLHCWLNYVAGREEGCACVCLDGFLAVELQSFTAVEGDGIVTLNWQTASERNNDHFEVMRDGRVAAANVRATNSPSGAHYTWTDRGLQDGQTYSYELVAVDVDGNHTTLASTEATPVTANAQVITEYALRQNYPNPFNPKTSISFDLEQSGFVKLTVYNPMGQQVTAVVSGEMPAGSHTVTFDASNLPSGMYLYRLEVNGFSATKKMLLMK
jgi:hypothetical protein